MTETLFYNVWRTETAEKKTLLIEAMRAEAPEISAKPGFHSMRVLVGEDDRVLVEGRWQDRAAFDAAIAQDAGAQQSRKSLEAFGTAEPAIFTEVFSIGPTNKAGTDYPSKDFWTQFERRQVKVNGLELNVVIGGEGEPVLLIHGFLETWAVWHRLMPMLAERYRVIVPDLRGFGDSEGNGTGYDKKTLASDMAKLLDKLGVGRAHVVGHDFGGQIAYRLAAERREQIATLTVIESLLPGINVTSRGDEGRFWIFAFQSAQAVPEMLTAGREREYVHALWDIFVEPNSEVTLGDRAEVEKAFARPGSLASGFEFYRSAPQDALDFTLQYGHRLLMPVLALGGEHCFETRVIEAFRQVATNVTGGIVEGASHFAPLERPAATLQQLLAFLANHPLEEEA